MSDDDDILAQNAAFDERISSDQVLTDLVKESQRSHTVIKWMAASIIFDILLSAALAVVAFDTHEDAQSAASRAVTACIQSADNSAVINNLLNELVANAISLDDVLTPAEIETRIENYEAQIITIPNCYAKEEG